MSDEDDEDPGRPTREIAQPAPPEQRPAKRRVAKPVLRDGVAHDGARLVAISGPDGGRKFALHERATIGRAARATIRLKDSLVSREHARIVRGADGVFTIDDLGSRHGTSVNGAPAIATRLRYGDRIVVGRTILVFSHRDPAEERLLESEQLEVLGRLGSGLVHDMNNLLAISQACAELLDDSLRRPIDDRATAEMRECVRDLRTTVERGRELNAQLLRLARRQPPETAELDFSALVEEALALARRTFGRKVQVAQGIQSGIRVVGSHAELLRAVMNLLLNARDAMPSGGALTISLRGDRETESAGPDRAPAVVRLRIADTGAGMDAETAARLFEPLFTTKTAGTGLGLSTVRRVVAEHGGRVRCESAPGRGTAFEVVLPCAFDDGAMHAPTTKPPAPSSF